LTYPDLKVTPAIAIESAPVEDDDAVKPLAALGFPAFPAAVRSSSNPVPLSHQKYYPPARRGFSDSDVYMLEEGDAQDSEPSFLLSDQAQAAHLMPPSSFGSIPMPVSPGFQVLTPPLPALPIVDSTPQTSIPSIPSASVSVSGSSGQEIHPSLPQPVSAAPIKVEQVDPSMIPQATQAKAAWMEFDMGPAPTPLKIEADLHRSFGRLDSGDPLTLHSIPSVSVGLDPESILLDNELVDKDLDQSSSQKLEDLHLNSLNWTPTPKAAQDRERSAVGGGGVQRRFPFKQENRGYNYREITSPQADKDVDYYDSMEISRPQTLSVPNWDDPASRPPALSPSLLLSPHLPQGGQQQSLGGLGGGHNVFDPFLISPRGYSQQQQLMGGQMDGFGARTPQQRVQ
jgi:hypothetical protein